MPSISFCNHRHYFGYFVICVVSQSTIEERLASCGLSHCYILVGRHFGMLVAPVDDDNDNNKGSPSMVSVVASTGSCWWRRVSP